ncbi:uncharacterized protein DS421_12g371560 [Arachis hypogaea]|nr:uncharacterized protein DS421_12g371560 [Arachis hypogaea]
MKVKQCDSLEEILSKEGEEITNDIAFFSLQTLELDSLPRLVLLTKVLPKIPIVEESSGQRMCWHEGLFRQGEHTKASKSANSRE